MSYKRHTLSVLDTNLTFQSGGSSKIVAHDEGMFR